MKWVYFYIVGIKKCKLVVGMPTLVYLYCATLPLWVGMMRCRLSIFVGELCIWNMIEKECQYVDMEIGDVVNVRIHKRCIRY